MVPPISTVARKATPRQPAEMNAVLGPVPHAARAEGATVAHTIFEDSPRVAGSVAVVPGGTRDFEIGTDAAFQRSGHDALSVGIVRGRRSINGSA